MRAETFLDTNILLYAISAGEDEAEKRGIARSLLAEGGWGLSVQVLQEFYVNVTRLPRAAMGHADAVAAVHQFLRRPTVASDAALMLEAFRLKERYRLSYWDASIIAAARALGARILYSEDLNHGQDYDGVTVENPFRAAESSEGPKRG
jgi:predicted nucleic acid-binding protein